MNILHTASLGQEIDIQAREILDRPRCVKLRLVECDDGAPTKVDGQWPDIVKIWQEVDGLYDYIYIATSDDPTGAFRLRPEGDVRVIPFDGGF
jgi:hypothetical protein